MQPAYLEYLTANEQTAYPFREGAQALVDDWAAVVVTGNATLTKDVLIDAVLVLPPSLVGDIYLRRITCVTATTYNLVFADPAGVIMTIMVDITVPPSARSVIQDVIPGPPDMAVRLLIGESFVPYLQKILADLGAGGAAQFGTRLPLETAAVEFRPRRVDKLTFVDHLSVSHDLVGDIGLYEGYNVGLDPDAGDISIQAAPGLGLGQDDSACGPTPAPPWSKSIVKLNGAIPDADGNVNINGTGCYRVKPDPANGQVIIYNDCKVCCTCDDYANFAKTITLLLERAALVWKGPFFPDPDYANLAKLAETLNSHITEYNGVVFPKIRTVGAWGHVMVGVNLAKASGDHFATIAFVVVNRVSSVTAIHGVATFNKAIQEADTSRKDEGRDQTATIVVSGFTVTFDVTLQPFTEEHLYVLVRSNSILTGLAGSLTTTWTQYGIPKSVTGPVT